MTDWKPEASAPRDGRLIIGAFVPTDSPRVLPVVRVAVWSATEDSWAAVDRLDEDDPADGWFFGTCWHAGALVAWRDLPDQEAFEWNWTGEPPKQGAFLALTGFPWPELLEWCAVDQEFRAADLQIGMVQGRPDPYFETDTRRPCEVLAWMYLPAAPVKRRGVWQ